MNSYLNFNPLVEPIKKHNVSNTSSSSSSSSSNESSSSSYDSDSSSGSSSDDDDDRVKNKPKKEKKKKDDDDEFDDIRSMEINRKLNHPERLHSDLTFNERDQVNYFLIFQK